MAKRVTMVAKKDDEKKKKKSSKSKKAPKSVSMLAIDLAPPMMRPGMGPAGPVGRRRRRMY